MRRTDEGAADACHRALDGSGPATTPSPANPVLALCRRIVERLPDQHVPDSVRGDCVAETHCRLSGFCKSLSPTVGEPMGHQWPGSRLTDGDMQRLNVLSNMTGLRVNEVLHLAVEIAFEEVRAVMTSLLAAHERTGTPLDELLAEAATVTPHAVDARPKEATKAAEPATVVQRRFPPRLNDAPADRWPIGTSILAAEAPAAGPRVQRLLSFSCDESA